MSARIGRGEAVLKIARWRARRQGETELAQKLNMILSDPDLAGAAGIALEDEVDSGFFREILSWIANNPEEFKAFIEFFLGFFASTDPMPIADA